MFSFFNSFNFELFEKVVHLEFQVLSVTMTIQGIWEIKPEVSTNIILNVNEEFYNYFILNLQ